MIRRATGWFRPAIVRFGNALESGGKWVVRQIGGGVRWVGRQITRGFTSVRKEIASKRTQVKSWKGAERYRIDLCIGGGNQQVMTIGTGGPTHWWVLTWLAGCFNGMFGTK